MQVTVTVRSKEQQFVGGTVGGNWRIEIALADEPGSVLLEYEGAGSSSTFDVNAGDTYIARGMRLDAADGVLGPIVSTQFVAGEDLVPIDVADSISVVSSPAARTPAKGARR